MGGAHQREEVGERPVRRRLAPPQEPAAPSTKAPVHTDVTYLAPSAWRRTNSIVSLSLRTSATPMLPPGTQIRSRLGHDEKAQVGNRLRPQSLGTGSVDLATMCVAESGNRARTLAAR
jgi:hypothetical protein